MRHEIPSSIRFFGDESVPSVRPQKPVNIAFLTSVRDTGTCDRNGSIIRTPEGVRYMEGAIERTVRESREGGALDGILRVVAVITDDREKDMRGSEYPLRPQAGRPWLHDQDLRNNDDSLVADPDTTHWIVSDFRSLPLSDTDGRAERKMDFERQVWQLMQQRQADVLVSDHYMARIAYLVNGTFRQFGRILNIHPAVTIPDHPFRFCGKTPTKDAIDRARSGVETRTGATLHVVDEIIDHGPPLAYIAETPVDGTDEPQHLRYRNYQLGKLPLFIAGMRHYIENVYPHLDQIDLQSLSPLPHVSVPAPR